eukprot:scaffold41548_cov53-Attheya_sp.AAC.3
MRIITGDECGWIKEVIPEVSRPVEGSRKSVATDEGISRLEAPGVAPSRSNGVVSLSFVPSNPNDSMENQTTENEDIRTEFSMAALRRNGTVETWDCQMNQTTEETKTQRPKQPGTYRQRGSVANVFASFQKEETKQNQNVVPISMISSMKKQDTDGTQSSNNTNNPILACVDGMGRLSLVHPWKQAVVASYEPFSSRNIGFTKGDMVNTQVCTAMAMDHAGERVALGGRERPCTLLDMETGKAIWKAKNLPPDPQTLLQHPIWSTAVEFLSPEMNVGGSNQIIAVGTAYKEMMLYDVRMDATVPTRRPIWHSKEGSIVEHRVTAICEDTERKAMIVGDAAGYIHTVDLRRLGKEGAGRYNGPCGSVRALFKHPTLPILACVGLDRMLRTFDMTNRRKQLDCVYLKQRVNTMLFCHDDTWSPSDGSLPNIIEDNHVDTTMNFAEGDIEQDDDVRDYIDSDEENEGDRSGSDDDDDDDDDDDEGEYETDDSGQEAVVVEDENDDAEDDSGSSDDEEDESDESDDSSEEEEMPKQRSRKQEGGKTDSKKKQRR